MSLHPPRRLRGDEALYLYLETPRSPMNVGLVAEVDGEIDGVQLSDELSRAVDHIPSLRCRLQAAPAGLLHPKLSAEQPLLIEDHFFEHEGAVASEVDQRAADILAPRLDRTKPLWELHLVQLVDVGRSVLVFKAHRAIVHEPSGLSLLSLLVSRMNRDRAQAASPEPIFHEIGRPMREVDVVEPAAKEESLPRELLRGGLEQLLGSFDWMRLASEPNRLALRTLNDIVPDLALPVKRLPFNRLGSGGREVARVTLSYAEARAVRQNLGGSIGDVSLTVVTAALARSLSHSNGASESRLLRLLCPLSTQFLLEDSTVATTYLPLALPLIDQELCNLYRAVRAQTRTLRAARVPQAIREALEVLTDWPAPTVAQLARAARFGLPCNALFTQVAGPQVALEVQGHKLREIHPVHSLPREHGIGFSSLSYNQRICIGVTTDQLAFSQLAPLCASIEDTMHELKQETEVGDMQPIEVGRPPAPMPPGKTSTRRRASKRPA